MTGATPRGPQLAGPLLANAHVRWIDTPLGPCRIEAGRLGVSRVHLTGCREPGRAATADAGPPHEAVRVGDGYAEAARHAARAATALHEYFDGARDAFEDLRLSLAGTPFQLRVWRALRDVPFGTTVSYGELARRLGQPGACRAVGMANHRNPAWLVVPCHRVVQGDGSLGGYAGGVASKRWLLEHERRPPQPGRAARPDPGVFSTGAGQAGRSVLSVTRR